MTGRSRTPHVHDDWTFWESAGDYGWKCNVCGINYQDDPTEGRSRTEELRERRADPFEGWWLSQRNTWEPLDTTARGDLWAMCRLAFYAGRKQATGDARTEACETCGSNLHEPMTMACPDVRHPSYDAST